MIKSILIPIILILIGLFMLPFFMIYGLPIIAVGVIWLIAALIIWNNKKHI